MFTPKVRLLPVTMFTCSVLLSLAASHLPLCSPRLSAAEPAKDSLKADKTFRLIQPQLRTISTVIEQTGVVEAYERTSIFPHTTAYLDKWHVDIGDKVKKGDVLASLYAPELREEWEVTKAQVALARERLELASAAVRILAADVKAAEAGLLEARALLDALAKAAPRDAARARVLRAEAKLASKQATREKGLIAVEVARAAVRAAETESKRLEALVGYLVLPAPFDGVITARNANTGELVSPRDAQPIYVVERSDIVRVVVNIPEQDANYVQKGTKATLRIRGFRDGIAATVTRTSWSLDAKTRNLRAEIDLANVDGRIWPGMSASSKLVIQRPKLLVVPEKALFHLGAMTFYWAYNNGRAVRTEIETGFSDGTWMEVINRRAPGPGGAWLPINGSERVIIGDLSILADGSEVTIVP